MVAYSLVDMLHRSNENNLQQLSSKVVFDAFRKIPREIPDFTSSNSIY
jgi:hypothetical protein